MSLFSVLSDMRIAVHVAYIKIKIQTCCNEIRVFQSLGTILHTGLWWGQLETHHYEQFHHYFSVVVQALAGLLEVAVALLRWGESWLSEVLPVEGAAAQLLPLSLGPGSLDSQQLDVAGQRDSPGSQMPRYVLPHCHWPGQTQEKYYSTC